MLGPMTEKNHKNQVNDRRDFLVLASGSLGVVGAGAFLYPFIHSMNPAADVLSMATVDVNLSTIPQGQSLTIMWQGKPVFIRHRTPQEIEREQKVSLKGLPDPQADPARVQKPQWLVVIGVCTHLGCVPTGQKTSENRGEFGGWYCPCHGSAYDGSGRIRQGPAPKNLEVPPYHFLNDTTIRIGQEKG
jgi:ubiquinol-cytochrome c reductase iron-sulfur subunit